MPSMVRTDRRRLRFSASHPCVMSSLSNIKARLQEAGCRWQERRLTGFPATATCCLPPLIQPDIAGSSVHGDGWTSVAHFADYTFALLLNPALPGRVDRMIHHHRSGIGGDVHVEANF